MSIRLRSASMLSRILLLSLCVMALGWRPGSVRAQVGPPSGEARVSGAGGALVRATAAVPTPEVFMWVGANRLLESDPDVLRDMLLFARRNGITPYSSGLREPGELDAFLSLCRSLGIERTWIEIGPDRRKAGTIVQFMDDPRRRAAALADLRELAEVYRRHYPDFARITLFDEAPLGGFQRPGDPDRRSYLRNAALFREHGPDAFVHLAGALKEGHPGVEVGIFLHHPHNASPAAAGRHSWIGEFMDRSAEAGAAPDFVFSDVYRGYFNRGYGFEATNAYITDVVANTVEAARRHGAKAFQLGQTHTIKIGYTPSRWEIDGNVAAMLAGDADGIGWYWPNYAATNHTDPGVPADVDVSFDPFVPNAWGAIGPAGSMYATSRDRWVYSYLRALEATEEARADGAHGPAAPGRAGGTRALDARALDHFDLWLYGHDFDHAEHEVRLRRADGSGWELLGVVNAQQDRGAYEDHAPEDGIYSYDGRSHVVVFHGLERGRFLTDEGDGEVGFEIRVETPDDADGSSLSAAFAVPHRTTRNFLTEAAVTRLVEDQGRWVAINALARHVRPRPLALSAGGVVEVTSGAPDASWAETSAPSVQGDDQGSSAASLSAGDDVPTASSADFLPAAFWRSQATTDVLPFWLRHARDTVDGGYRAFLDRRWGPSERGGRAERDSRFPGMLGRHLFSSSVGYLLTGEAGHLERARGEMDRMVETGWDDRYGGWYNEIDATGAVVDDGKDLFMQLYAATGLAMYWIATRDSGAEEYLDRTLALLDEHAWDEERGGYVRSLSRDLSVAEPRKDISPQVAPLSGFLVYLHSATGDERWLRRAERVLDVVLERMRDPDTGWVLEHFTPDWTAVPGGRRSDFRVSVGHNLEVAWMAARLHRMTGRDDYRRVAEDLGSRILEAAFLPERGAWLHHFSLADPSARSGSTPWWVQAYGNMQQLEQYRLTGDERHLEAYRRGAAFWNEHVVDRMYGGTFLSVDTLGGIARGDKAVRTKTSYHAMEHALLNYLHTGLRITGEPVTLHYRIEQPAGEVLRPLPVAEPEARIMAVEVDGRPWTDFDATGGRVRLPEAEGPVPVRVTFRRNAAADRRFDLVLYGKGLDPAGVEVALRTNPSNGERWVRPDTLGVEPEVHRGDDGWNAVVYPGLGATTYLGRDIRENHLTVRLKRSMGEGEVTLAAAYAVPSSGRPAGEVARTVAGALADDPLSVERSSLAAVVHPRPRILEPGGSLTEHVEAPARHRPAGEVEVEWLEIIFRYGR